jgi:hypothetical protein
VGFDAGSAAVGCRVQTTSTTNRGCDWRWGGGGTAAIVGAAQPQMKKRKTNSLNSLMQMTKALEPAELGSSSTAVTSGDELEKYLALPQETLCDGFDLLVWWKQRGQLYLNLSKMVKVIMACPIPSAGAEHVFSCAGRMHKDGRAVRYTTLHASFKTLHEFQSRKLYTPLYITLLYIKLYTARGGAYFIFSTAYSVLAFETLN